MRFKNFITALILLTLVIPVLSLAQNTEQEMVNKFLQRTESKHITKTGFVAVNFTVNRINRHNEYNDFTNQVSNEFTNGDFSWLNTAQSFGLDLGMVFKDRWAWSLGGEYWLKMSDELDGSFTYLATGDDIDNPSSEIQVYGIYTGIQYYIFNHPHKVEHITGMSLRVGGTVGYYEAKWDLWPEYENLNLTTGVPATSNNTTFKGTAPGFTIGMGLDYPLNLFGMVFGADLSYMYLNFTNVAWYNNEDEEIIVTTNGTPEGRVDLGLSGFRAKMELKRFFSF
ncbi:MAG: hypothetical protein ACOYVF_11820 [Candidatus Zixiibacteriota bacterium]